MEISRKRSIRRIGRKKMIPICSIFIMCILGFVIFRVIPFGRKVHRI